LSARNSAVSARRWLRSQSGLGLILVCLAFWCCGCCLRVSVTFALDGQDMSPLQDRIFQVASKLSSLSDSLLLLALPTICGNLTNPDKDVRAPVIAFVGELFAAEGSKLPLHFSTSYRQWLDRFQDSDTAIRSSMVEAATALLDNHQDAAVVEPVAKALRAKLNDPDKDVRACLRAPWRASWCASWRASWRVCTPCRRVAVNNALSSRSTSNGGVWWVNLRAALLATGCTHARTLFRAFSVVQVRRRAVQCICELAAHGCPNISKALLRAVGDRCLDRVSGVRSDAVTGLAQVYKHVISSKWERAKSDDASDDDDDGDDEGRDGAGAAGAMAHSAPACRLPWRIFARTDQRNAPIPACHVLCVTLASCGWLSDARHVHVRACVFARVHACSTPAAPVVVLPELEEHLGWIPSQVIKSFHIQDMELRTRVVQLLDEILLPKSLTAANRAAGLVHIFANLDPEAKGVFGRIQAYRQTIQGALLQFASKPQDDQVGGACEVWAGPQPHSACGGVCNGIPWTPCMDRLI
jgi:hypothetical protein